MRVIAGEAKGRRLLSPKSPDIRPVLDQVKEAVFNILFDVAGLCVLDLFAGTGAVGIEALSRGAKKCVFADSGREAVSLIRKNLELCRMENRGKILPLSAGKAVDLLSKQGRPFDLIFVDPPYEKGFVRKTLGALSKSGLLHDQTLLVVEHHPKEPIGVIGGLVLTDARKYGQTLISFLKMEIASPP